MLVHRMTLVFFFRLFLKNWATYEIFLGKWYTEPPLPPPPRAKNCPYAYDTDSSKRLLSLSFKQDFSPLAWN